MKRFLLAVSFFMGVVSTSLGQECTARYTGDIPSGENFFALHPFPLILDFIDNPDTIILCNLPRFFCESKNIPVSINLIVYKKNKQWYGATLRTYASKRKMKYELSDTLLIYGEIDELIEDMKEEARRVEVVDYDMTLNHSEIYTRSGDEIYLSMLGTYPRLVESMPKMCKFVSVCLFKLVTDKIIKKYTRKR